MFTFRKKNKDGERTEQLLRLVKQDPDNVKNRLRLADHCLRTGDRKSAIVEYRSAAQYLQREGFNLKAISMYKKLFSLNAMSLNDYKSLAVIYGESGLFVEARKTYQEILRIEPNDQEALTALGRLEEEGKIPSVQETEHQLGTMDTVTGDDSDAVPIETLLAPSELDTIQAVPSGEPIEAEPRKTDSSDLSEDTQKSSETISENHGVAFELDGINLQPNNRLKTTQPSEAEISNRHPTLPGKILPDMDLSDLTEDTEDTLENAFPEPHKHSEIDSTPFQLDEILQGEDGPEQGTTPAGPSTVADEILDLTKETLSTAEEEQNAPPDPSGPEIDLASSPLSELETQIENSDDDPDLHYHLGVAYREMELTDRAIEEFTKALERGNKSLECLTMLAKCYFEKGLFQESAAFIHRALKLDKLNQDQIDLLHRQLDEAEAVGKLG
jgi:tetratricopeptide (TPR) repeat protein